METIEINRQVVCNDGMHMQTVSVEVDQRGFSKRPGLHMRSEPQAALLFKEEAEETSQSPRALTVRSMFHFEFLLKFNEKLYIYVLKNTTIVITKLTFTAYLIR